MSSNDKNPEKLYFIALVPPSPLREKAQALKEYFRDAYNSKASLNSPPHITLHMPFRFKTKNEEKLIRAMENFAKEQTAFTVDLKNFGAFPPRVIFVDVAPSQALENLQAELQRTCRQQLNLHNANYKERAFHPHLTLAFRDLRKAQFKEAWTEFEEREFEDSFTADRICLLKHDGKRWQEFREFHF